MAYQIIITLVSSVFVASYISIESIHLSDLVGYTPKSLNSICKAIIRKPCREYKLRRLSYYNYIHHMALFSPNQQPDSTEWVACPEINQEVIFGWCYDWRSSLCSKSILDQSIKLRLKKLNKKRKIVPITAHIYLARRLVCPT